MSFGGAPFGESYFGENFTFSGVVEIPLPGIEYSADTNHLHYRISANQLHYVIEPQRMHYTVRLGRPEYVSQD